MKVKRIGDHDLPIPCQATDGSAGYDLYLSDLMFALDTHRTRKVPTGWAFEIPKGYVGIIKEKSGSDVEDIAIDAGVIDLDYQGQVMVKVRLKQGYPRRTIKQGEPIAQLIIVKAHFGKCEEVEEFTKKTMRGKQGFGHSRGEK